MFEVGFTEIILICGLALIVLGPQRLPKLAMQVGRWVGRARAMARQLREQLDQEVNLTPDPPRWQSRAQPAPDVDPYADPHDTRSHADAGETAEEPPAPAQEGGAPEAQPAATSTADEPQSSRQTTHERAAS